MANEETLRRGVDNTDRSTLDEHVSADSHGHIHRHAGELWSVSPGEISVAAGDVLDVVVQNPSGSGKTVEVLTWSGGFNDAAKLTQYRDSGLYTGNATAITPLNFDDNVTESASLLAEYQTGTGDQLIDTTSDAQFNGGVYSSASSGANLMGTVAGRPALDVTVGEGRDFGVRIEAINGVDPIMGLVVAEYDGGRDFSDS